MDDFEEVWLEIVMARERDYWPTLRQVAIAVATTAPVVALGAVVVLGAPPKGAPPYGSFVHRETTRYEDASLIFDDICIFGLANGPAILFVYLDTHFFDIYIYI